MEIGLLGTVTVHDRHGAPVPLRGRRARILLALLALNAGRVVTSSWLVDRVWGDAPPDGASNALQALVSRLRRQLPAGSLSSHPAGYRLDLAPRAVDVHRFQELTDEARAALSGDPGAAAAQLGEALALWRGPALADLTGAEFAEAERAKLDELRVTAVEDRATAALQLGDGARMVADLEAVVAAHPTRERATGLLMRALCAAGRSGDALHAYERTRAALADRLGADPTPDLADLHRRILRGDPRLLPSPPVGDGHRPTNLRAELTSFIGREDALARVRKLVRESRLTTLTGPGGAGKTRLAVESARTLVDNLPGGVWLVELAPVSDPADVPYAVLGALGLRDQRPALTGRGGDPDRTQPPGSGADAVRLLVQAMADKQALLVLDNCEHVVDAAADLAHRLLTACPGLRVLATSREPLGITGEALWPVEPLGAPDPDAPASEAAAHPAVRLLADRAGAASPDFSIAGERGVQAAARVCRALDGVPLAIELAAARLRTMTLDQLADRLDDRFQVLTGGSRTALPRHRTLRAVVDWSWELLDRPERTLLRRLSVFAGTVSLTAAEQVCAGPDLPAGQILERITALVDKSLVVPCPSAGESQPRFRLLETIKAYGAARLAEAGEAPRLRAAHAEYFLALAEAGEPRLRGPAQQEWLGRLSVDGDDLHAALRWAIGAGETDTAVRMVAALGWFWSLRGRRLEGTELARQALALPGEVPDDVRALAYTVAAVVAVDWVDLPTAECWFQAAVELAQRTDQRHPMLRLVTPLYAMFEAIVAPRRSRLPRESLDQLRDDPDPWVRATMRVLWVQLALHTGDPQPGLLACAEEATAAYLEAGDRWGEAFARHTRAELAALAGDLDTAVAENQYAVAQVSALGVPEDRVQFRVRLAEQLWARGERRHAGGELAIAAREADRVGLALPQATVARAAGDLARLDGDLATAGAELARAADLSERRCGSSELLAAVTVAHAQLAIADGDLAAAREQLTTALTIAYQAGYAPAAARSLVCAADLALAEADPTRAAELLGAAEAVRGFPDRGHPDVTRTTAAAGAALGETRFAEAHARGRADPDPYVVELGVAEVSPVRPSA